MDATAHGESWVTSQHRQVSVGRILPDAALLPRGCHSFQQGERSRIPKFNQKMTTKLKQKRPEKLCRFVLKGHREGKRPELRDPSTAAAQSIIPTSLDNVDFIGCGCQFHGSTG